MKAFTLAPPAEWSILMTKNVKRLLAYILTAAAVLSVCPFTAFAEVSFGDIDGGHWAYSAIMTLVADGTVRGFEDGEFKPDQAVSRAEFVKMLGMGSTRSTVSFGDVPADHWGYDYIMTSGLDGINGNFMPDTAITRDDVAALLWARNGSNAAFAPSIVTSQAKNEQAAAWVYATGLMIGDDGISLRFNEGLTRAEASVIIVRAKDISEASERFGFTDLAQPEMLNAMFEAIHLFDDGIYDPNRVITNGEMAKAAVRLMSEEFQLTYVKLDIDRPFDHPAAADVYVMGNAILGKDKITAEFVDKPANMQDTIAAIVYTAIRQSHGSVRYGNTDNTYSDVSDMGGGLMNICLTFAYERGIHFNADGKLNPQKSVTMKDFAALLLQLDRIIGLQLIYVSNDDGSFSGVDAKVNKAWNSYPETAEQFRYIDEALPNVVYFTPFSDVAGTLPKKYFDFAREQKLLFTDFFTIIRQGIESGSSAKLRFTYYPSLVCNVEGKILIRAKLEVLDNPKGLSLKELLGGLFDGETDLGAGAGATVYLDFSTAQTPGGITLMTEIAKVVKIVHAE